MEILQSKMLITISRKIEDMVRKLGLVIIDIVISTLWFIERITSFTFREFISFSKKFSVVVIAVGGLITLGYFMYSGYLSTLAEYIFSDKLAQTQLVITYLQKSSRQKINGHQFNWEPVLPKPIFQ